MTFISIVIIALSLFFAELLYFKLANKFNIIDQPNHRSSHTIITLRGGGIIFSFALLVYPFVFGFEYKYFLLGLTAISVVSFLDDIKPVSSKVRIVVHLIAVAMMFYQLHLFNLQYYWIVCALFLVIGSINAINFMDGINGITGSYALITLVTFLLINVYIIPFTENSILIMSIISIAVFNYFNFRTKAKCFAGDVGSVSIAFIILFFLLQLIIKTENFNYLLLLLLYGLDTVTTIGFRIIRKERVFEPHRSHFYQYWANDRQMPHLLVSSIYSSAQLVFNLIVVFYMPNSPLLLVICLVLSGIFFMVLRFRTEGSTKLLRN